MGVDVHSTYLADLDASPVIPCMSTWACDIENVSCESEVCPCETPINALVFTVATDVMSKAYERNYVPV